VKYSKSTAQCFTAVVPSGVVISSTIVVRFDRLKYTRLLLVIDIEHSSISVSRSLYMVVISVAPDEDENSEN
jgi:hypothetical protein